MNVLKCHLFLIKPNDHEPGEVIWADQDGWGGARGGIKVAGRLNVLASISGPGACWTSWGGAHRWITFTAKRVKTRWEPGIPWWRFWAVLFGHLDQRLCPWQVKHLQARHRLSLTGWPV